MISLLQFSIISALVILGSCYHSQQKFITFNTSSTKYVISTSISTNFDHQFSIYCPVLVHTKDSLVQFSISEQKKKLIAQPKFLDENKLLYNDYSEGEYWYGFKKSNDPKMKDTTATFALTKVIVDSKSYDFFMPLFNLPLSFLSVGNLYKCDDVLISYRKTNKLSDITVFSAKQEWSLLPEASWGFRNQDQGIYFSRQTYPLGTQVQINVAANKYCLINQDLKQNTYNLEEKDIYILNDLLIKYSSTLEVKDRNKKENNQQDL